MEIGYFEAWHLWFSGETVSQHFLYGVKILWWGRTGKIVQFLSIAGLVVEIVGERPFRELAHHFRRVSISLTPNKIMNAERDPPSLGFALMMTSFLASPYIFLIIATLYKGDGFSRMQTFFLICGAIFIAIFIALMIKRTKTISYIAFGIIIPVLFFSEIIFAITATLSSKKSLNVLLVLLILIGFHFDLLAS